MWKGTAVNLNKKPTNKKIIPTSQARNEKVLEIRLVPQVKSFANSEKFVIPVKP